MPSVPTIHDAQWQRCGVRRLAAALAATPRLGRTEVCYDGWVQVDGQRQDLMSLTLVNEQGLWLVK